MSIQSDLTSIKTLAGGVADNKITNLAYDSTAYSANTVASPESYDWSQHNNIPQQTTSAMKMTETQIDKGWRLRFPILNKYFFNAFFGRVSYNLNKLSDLFQSTLTALINALGTANGIATLDSSGRLPASQATETLLSYKGTWLASTNTPALSDGMSGAVKGDMYLCDDSGTVTFGTGNTLTFLPNDRVVYNGSQWRKWSAEDVRSVSEVLPDGNGNIDLTQQNDIYKVLDKTIVGRMLYEGIGRNWVQCTGGESYTFRCVAYGNGVRVACSVSHGLWWSEDGKTFTQSDTSTIAGYSFNFAVYLNNLWLAGSESNGLWWSTDGKTWSQATGDLTHGFRSVVFADNLYVASANGTGMWWSTDGKAWTQGTGSNIAYVMNKVIYQYGLFVAGSENGVWWSEDGKAWTKATGNTGAVYTVAYGNFMFVAGGTAGIWASTTGKSWSQTSTSAIRSYTFNIIAYADGVFLAGSTSHGLYKSTNGTSWTSVTGVPTTGTVTSIRYGNRIWIVGTTGKGFFMSPLIQATYWYAQSLANLVNNVPNQGVSFAEGMFIIATTTGLYYSDWTTVL